MSSFTFEDGSDFIVTTTGMKEKGVLGDEAKRPFFSSA